MLAQSGDVVGQFRWDTDTETLSWSNGIFRLHGYPPAAVSPTPDLVLEHKVTEDRVATGLLMNSVRTVDRPFVNYHRIVDAGGHEHVVLSVGASRSLEPSAARPSGSRVASGFMADITERHRESLRGAVVAAHQHGASIQQAQGAIMALYGLGEDAAFSLLRWYSQNHNVKVSVLAERLVRSFSDHPEPLTRARMDRLMFDQATSAEMP